jgi:hypothetical protein
MKIYHLFILAVLWSVMSDSPEGKGAEVTIETIAKTWQSRQDRVQTASFAWTEQETQTKGCMTALFAARAGRRPENGKASDPIPPQDGTFDVSKSLALDGGKLRYQFEGKPGWLPEKNDWITSSQISVLNNGIVKTLSRSGFVSWPNGHTEERADHPDAQNVNIQPLLMTYRPQDAKMSAYRVSKCLVSPNRQLFAGNQCVVLEDTSVRPENSRQYWVDPSRDFVIVRYLYRENGRLYFQMDVDYSKDQRHGWVPSGWIYTILNERGEIARSFRARVTEWTINEALSPQLFIVEYPVGSSVHEPEHWPTPQYLIKADGTKRIVPPEDIGATYEQAMRTEPGHAFDSPANSSWNHVWIAAIVVSVIVAVGMVMGWKRWRSRSLQSSPK